MIINSSLQRQQLLCAYLLTHRGLIPTVIQPCQGKQCVVTFTRHYFEYLAKGGAPVTPMDLTGIDDILSQWDREAAR